MRAVCVVMLAVFVSAELQAQRVETGMYVMYQGETEVTREIYDFDGTTLTNTVDFATRGIRMESVARYDAEYTPDSYVLEIFRDSGEVPVQQVSVMFSDTAANWSTHTPLVDSTGVTQLDGRYAFMQNLVFAHLAVVLLKYDHERGGTQSLDVWMPEQAALLNMEIEFTSSARGLVEFAGTVMNVEVDDSGWLRRAAVPAQNVTVESHDPGMPGA